MLYIRKNEYNSFTFTVTNCDGTDYDFSKSTVKFIVKKTSHTEDALAILQGEIANSEVNSLMFDFSAAETKDLEEGSYVMALKEYRERDINRELWNDNCKVVKGSFNG